MEKSSQRFARLFRGFENAHGRFTVASAGPDGKVNGRAITVPSGPAIEDYERHLQGSSGGLGVIPLLINNKCYFGAIDLDIRGPSALSEELTTLEKRIPDPLILCRSKSGGAHLYQFFTSPVPAADLIGYLNGICASLGYGGSEVFPKQQSRADPNLDRGSWINLPYYDAKDTKRYAIHKGKKLGLEAFLNLAEKRSLDEIPTTERDTSSFTDGPPCLQHLESQDGFEEGNRNSGLFNVGVFLRKQSPDDWQELLMKFNFTNLSTPLPSGEISSLIKSLTRKDYQYTCLQPPISRYCEKRLCLTRKYGVGKPGGTGPESSLMIDAITKLQTEDGASTRWFLDVQGERIECTTPELLDQRRLQRILLERLNRIPSLLPGKEFVAKINALLENVETIIDPEEASEFGLFKLHLDRFLTGRVQARNSDELMSGKPWHDEGKVFFRSDDLFSYLETRRFKVTSPHAIWSWLRSVGADRKTFRLKGKPVKVWFVDEPIYFDPDDDLEIPSQVTEQF